MKPIALFYHCLFLGGDPPQLFPAAPAIILRQMTELEKSGLLAAASHFCVGINGGDESRKIADKCLPGTAHKVFHGLQCKNENRTILELEKWLPFHDDWNVLYFHSKGATHSLDDPMAAAWRGCMMKHCVTNWRRCVQDLDSGHDMVGVHWMEPPATPEGQYIFAGTFNWSKASYLLTLPSLMQRDRIKVSGLDAPISRYEAEVYFGNGPVKPHVKDYHGPGWNPGAWSTCVC